MFVNFPVGPPALENDESTDETAEGTSENTPRDTEGDNDVAEASQGRFCLNDGKADIVSYSYVDCREGVRDKK